MADITFDLPEHGITVLMGPVGTGKSSLLCSLAGIHNKNPRFKSWGAVSLDGQAVTDAHRPSLVHQQTVKVQETVLTIISQQLNFSKASIEEKQLAVIAQLEAFGANPLLARLNWRMLDLDAVLHRIALIVAAAITHAPLLMIDEPTADLNEQDAQLMMQFLHKLGKHRKLLVVLHNQAQAQDLADDIVLIAGGRVQFHGATSDFFNPALQNDVVRQFVKTGSVSIAAPDARREHLADDVTPPPPLPQAAIEAVRSFSSPVSFPKTLVNVVPNKTSNQIHENTKAIAHAEKMQRVRALEAKIIEAKNQVMQAHTEAVLTQSNTAQSQKTIAASPNPTAQTVATNNAKTTEPVTEWWLGLTSHVNTNRNKKTEFQKLVEKFVTTKPDSASATPTIQPTTAQPIVTQPVTEKPLVALPDPSREGVSIVAQIGQYANSASRGPAGFSWIVPDMIAGCPMPGATAHIDYDLTLLRAIGVTRLITLTEDDLDQAALKKAGLSNLHLSIYDREAPSLSQMHMLLFKMQKLISQGEVLAVHCLAGLGRTGTVLAAWMIKEGGLSAEEAMRRLRLINPSFIQSAVQEAFLAEFENDILRRMR